MNLAEEFAARTLTSLDLTRYARVSIGSRVRDVVAAMNEANRTCACVSGGGAPIGMLTDRDVLTRVVGYPLTWDMPVEMVMTPEPESVFDTSSVAAALEVMNRFRFRNLPVVDETGRLIGNLDRFSLLRFAAKVLFSEDSVGEHELAAQHGLLFVDFSGLELANPVVVTPDADLKHVVHTMRGRGIGSVLVVNGGGETVGIFTDHDAQARVACKVENLAMVPVASVMTPGPMSLPIEAHVGDGLKLMAEHGLSHIPLTDQTGQAVAMVSFRDIADYVETILKAMG